MFYRFDVPIKQIAEHLRSQFGDNPTVKPALESFDVMINNGVFDPIYRAVEILHSGKLSIQTEELTFLWLDEHGLGETKVNDLIQVYELGAENGN